MRTITIITEGNSGYFEPILPEGKSSSPDVMRLGVIEDGAPAAAAEVQMRDGICEINSFFVVESYRRKGIGTDLLDAVIRLAKDSSLNGIRVDYEKILGFSEFLEKNGFYVVPGNPVYQVPMKALINTKWVRDALTAKEDKRLTSLKTALIREKRSLKMLLDKHGYDMESIYYMDSDEDLSMVFRNRYGAVFGVVLAAERDGDVFVTLLISDLNDSKVVINTLSRMVAATFHWRKMPEKFSFFAESKNLLPFLTKMVGKESISSEVLTESAFLGFMEEDELSDMINMDITEGEI